MLQKWFHSVQNVLMVTHPLALEAISLATLAMFSGEAPASTIAFCSSIARATSSGSDPHLPRAWKTKELNQKCRS